MPDSGGVRQNEKPGGISQEHIAMYVREIYTFTIYPKGISGQSLSFSTVKKMMSYPPVHQPSWSSFDSGELKFSLTGKVEDERETIAMQTGEGRLVPEE